MNINDIFKTATVSSIFLFTACSAILPYENEFSCSAGSKISHCDNVTNIYNKIENDEIETAKSKKKNIKSEKIQQNNLEKENHELKLLLKATQAEKLRSDRKTIVLEGDYLTEDKKYEKNGDF